MGRYTHDAATALAQEKNPADPQGRRFSPTRVHPIDSKSCCPPAHIGHGARLSNTLPLANIPATNPPTSRCLLPSKPGRHNRGICVYALSMPSDTPACRTPSADVKSHPETTIGITTGMQSSGPASLPTLVLDFCLLGKETTCVATSIPPDHLWARKTNIDKFSQKRGF